MGLHNQLLESVRCERAALENADLKAIHDATNTKEAILARIRQVELARQRIVEELAAIWVAPMDQLTLARIIERIQGVDLRAADQLRSVMNSLTVLVSRLREQNLSNQALVRESLKHVTEMKKNVLGEALPGGPAYDRQGQRKSGPGGARLIAQEA
ncbi:MAG: flagellar protein FlgN [Bdellovibrionales bacterium]|nr:flagellar protein FlgN [Bdellovibrionales bacterium]